MNNKTLKITMIGLMAALCYVAFTFMQIKIPTPGGATSFHLGNTFCVLAALLLGGVPGGVAGAIGMGIGDLLDPTYVIVAPKTIILKLGIGIVTGLVAHKVFHIQRLEGKKLYQAVILSTIAGMLFNVVGEPIFSYFYTTFILGAPEKAAKALASWNAITTSINAILAVIISSSIYIAIAPRLQKNGILKQLAPKD
ncbi:MAG: ECF transporter S component [Longibaculum muris]|uniref:Putative membrane protein n=1 Tax=Longibaculum muris TaxID=1796628 RepID=A0A4R3YJ05_9FIRM|nr:ECF transporter S component [Longibaculum muris]KXU52084.1 hypothetical protein HMPREF3037_00423 [Candidatus Stoquefichus sp. KLE1796]MBS5369623.1 ECF transporter S component [Coprobacillus cateniformis]MCR1889450.1 ECF transporter S component [Longibaculum muris]MED9812550.1 ECF transporter S component [Longibaculum muris]TCV90984.1 putative membrane protein [Longibaculum muris]